MPAKIRHTLLAGGSLTLSFVEMTKVIFQSTFKCSSAIPLTGNNSLTVGKTDRAIANYLPTAFKIILTDPRNPLPTASSVLQKDKTVLTLGKIVQAIARTIQATVWIIQAIGNSMLAGGRIAQTMDKSVFNAQKGIFYQPSPGMLNPETLTLTSQLSYIIKPFIEVI